MTRTSVSRAIQLSPSALADILRHAGEEAPAECCGLLIGGANRIDRAVRAHNLDPSPTRYLIDPADHFAAIRAARAAGQTVIGAYHSHVKAPAVPSQSDVAESTGDTDFVHVIVSLAGGPGEGNVAAYYFKGDGFEPVTLEVLQ